MIASVQDRGMEGDVDMVCRLADERKALTQEIDAIRRQRNSNARAMRDCRSPEDRQPLIEKGNHLKQQIATLEKRHRTIDERLQHEVGRLPNMIHPDTPRGSHDNHNRELHRHGSQPDFDFPVRDHVELGLALDIVDFDRAARVSGQKFYYLRNEGAFLELALIHYAMDILRNCNFEVMITPDIARQEIAAGIGFNPRGPESNVYTIEGEETCLIGTAEITLGGYHCGDLLDSEALPIRLGGLSHCFRREAGAAGRSSRGLFRVHQFSKVEMFVICHPHESAQLHGELLQIEERIFSGLEIPYRVVEVCSGDLGAPAYRKFDIEAWMPGRNKSGEWGEITSASNCTDYQARRLKVRLRGEHGNEYAHMLNGTAMAVSRAIVALLENHQQADGTVHIPPALEPYTGFSHIAPKRASRPG